MIDKLKVKQTMLLVQQVRLTNELNKFPFNVNLINYLVKDILKLTKFINDFKPILSNLN
jgi:hypothetical protein